MLYAKHIEGCLKQGKAEEGLKKVGFYNGQMKKINELKGFVMINNFEDKQKDANLSFWEITENMDN